MKKLLLGIIALMLDDFTFEAAGALPADTELTGYNIYRNGKKLNDSPVSATEATDKPGAAGIYAYSVSAVYNNASESKACTPRRILHCESRQHYCKDISEIISKDSINFIEGVAIYIATLLILYDIKANFARNITPNTNEPIYIEPKNSLSSSRRIARRGGNNGNMLPCVRRLCHKCN